jgi:hypothetical protein
MGVLKRLSKVAMHTFYVISGSFCKAKKYLFEQAQKAMYGVIRKIRQFKLSVKCQLGLFDKVHCNFTCINLRMQNLEIREFTNPTFEILETYIPFKKYGLW